MLIEIRNHLEHLQAKPDSSSRSHSRCGDLYVEAQMKTGLMRIARLKPASFTGRVRGNFHRRRCPCARCNNPGKRPGGRHAVQRALL